MAGQDAKKSDGAMGLLVPLVVVTGLGGGGGWFLGASALAPPEGAPAPNVDAGAVEEAGRRAPKAGHGDGSGHGGASVHGGAAPTDAAQDGTADRHGGHGEPLASKELPAIVTNLGASKNWLRLQAAMIFDPHELGHPDELVAVLTADLTAFINTLDVRDIEGADGLRRLQEELNERAKIRSDGHVRELIVESLVVQ